MNETSGDHQIMVTTKYINQSVNRTYTECSKQIPRRTRLGLKRLKQQISPVRSSVLQCLLLQTLSPPPSTAKQTQSVSTPKKSISFSSYCTDYCTDYIQHLRIFDKSSLPVSTQFPFHTVLSSPYNAFHK